AGELAALAHLAIATLVTIHVLLYKRNVGAAVSWIGVAWLSPFLGGLLYAALGVNRVKRRAPRLRRQRPPLRATAAGPGPSAAGEPPAPRPIAPRRPARPPP